MENCEIVQMRLVRRIKQSWGDIWFILHIFYYGQQWLLWVAIKMKSLDYDYQTAPR